MYTLRSNIVKPLQSLLHIFLIVLVVMEKVQIVKKKNCMASILRTLTVAKKQFFARKSQFFFNPSCSFLHVIHCVCLWFVHDVNICTFVIAVVTSSGSDGEDSDSFTGFSQHTVCGRRHHITVTACCLAVMCFLMMGHRVW